MQIFNNIVSYKLTLTKSIAKDWTSKAFLPSASMETELQAAIAVDLQQPLREFRVKWALCPPGNLVGQVFRVLDVFRNRFYDLNPCISSYLEKH